MSPLEPNKDWQLVPMRGPAALMWIRDRVRRVWGLVSAGGDKTAFANLQEPQRGGQRCSRTALGSIAVNHSMPPPHSLCWELEVMKTT